MPNMGFAIISAGVGPASYTAADIALSNWTPSGGVGGTALERIYTLGDFGSSGVSFQTMVVGSAATSRWGGHPFPNRDNSGRAFPLNLAGKYIKISIEGGLNVTGELMTVELKISEDRGASGLNRLYEWEGPINLRTMYLAGVTVEGTSQQVRLQGNRSLYERLMRFHLD